MANYRCPRCGSSNVGTSTMHKAKKFAAYAGDFLMGYGAARYGGAEAVDALVENGGFSNIEFAKELECKNCGYKWKDNGDQGLADTIPDHVIEEQKDELEQEYRSKAKSGLTWSVINAVVAGLCGYYCYTHDASSQRVDDTFLGTFTVTDYNWTWIFLCIIGIFCAIFAITKFSGDYCDNNKIANKLERMSVASFRTSKYRK